MCHGFSSGAIRLRVRPAMSERNRMIELIYTLETGAVLTDYMQTRNARKSIDKLKKRVYGDEFLHLGPVSLETAGIVSVSYKLMEIN